MAKGSEAQHFSAVLGPAISTTTISYLFIFPSLYCCAAGWGTSSSLPEGLPGERATYELTRFVPLALPHGESAARAA
jgi:hypothetical protein